MQTFLPYPSFGQSARVLDRQRLGKQRVEGVQILRTNLGLSTSGWRNHPAVKMWHGYEPALWHYTSIMCQEWERRGYNSTGCNAHLSEMADILGLHSATHVLSIPKWIGDDAVHESHRANLVRKLPEHYGPLWPDVDPTLAYVWP